MVASALCRWTASNGAALRVRLRSYAAYNHAVHTNPPVAHHDARTETIASFIPPSSPFRARHVSFHLQNTPHMQARHMIVTCTSFNPAAETQLSNISMSMPFLQDCRLLLRDDDNRLRHLSRACRGEDSARTQSGYYSSVHFA